MFLSKRALTRFAGQLVRVLVLAFAILIVARAALTADHAFGVHLDLRSITAIDRADEKRVGP
jgi:hypothetical protein